GPAETSPLALHDALPIWTPQLGKEIVATLRALVGQQSGDIQKRRRGTAYIGRAVQVLVQFRDFASAEELMNLFIELFPQYGESRSEEHTSNSSHVKISYA